MIGKGHYFKFLNKGITNKILYFSKIRRPSSKKTRRFRTGERQSDKDGSFGYVKKWVNLRAISKDKPR